MTDSLLNGRFRVLRSLGGGGMASVDEAEDVLLDRHVAIKTPHLHLLKDAAYAERFRREARAASKLNNHPTIAIVYDVFETSGEPCCPTVPHIVFEYVEGDTLLDLVQAGRLTPADALTKTAQLLVALDYAHSNGVIHRDIKPSNVMVSSTGDLKLLDFGVARIEAAETITKGLLMGTQGYMAPEQLMGNRTDGRVDLYATGCLLYMLLTGEPLFDGTFGEVVAKQINAQPAPLADHGVTGIPQVQAILTRVLQKDPDQRYQTAAEMLDAVRSALAELTGSPTDQRANDATVPLNHDGNTKVYEEETVRPAQEAVRPRVRKWRPALLWGGGSGLVAIAILASFLTFNKPPAAPTPPPATATVNSPTATPVAEIAGCPLSSGFLAAGWGPERPVFTFEEGGAPYPVFNSLTDNPNVGDERNFTRIRVKGATQWADTLNPEVGDSLEIRVLIYNGGRDDLVDVTAGALSGARLKVIIYRRDDTYSVFGWLSADNAITVWDGVTVNVPHGAHLSSDGPTKLYNNANSAGRPLQGVCAAKGLITIHGVVGV